MLRQIACLVLVLAINIATAGRSEAQENVWIQVEAHPSLTVAQTRAREFAARLNDVNGFSLGSGWYGIALGPYGPGNVGSILNDLRSRGAIPRDSYVVTDASLGNRFYPVGADLRPDQSAATTAAATEPAAVTPPQPAADETPAEARRSEAQLSREEREALQVALRWAGFYNAAIDGAFGRGTRASMSNWQEANGFEVTGILTTMQRAELLRQYNAVLDGMGLQTVTDEGAGITMQIPTGAVRFDSYEYPFARYLETGTVPGAQLYLISQAGDQSTLFGLYEILQTLEIVPLDGPRERGASSFVIEGANARIASYTEARLSGGAVKGFTLVWPAGDEERRTRLLDEMRASFSTSEGVIDPSFVDDDAQGVDLLAGLDIRRPLRSRSGVFVGGDGAVLTVTEAVEGCGRVTLESDFDARIVARDDAAGLVLLRPEEALAPVGTAVMGTATPRIQSEVAAAGYSYEGALGAPTLTFGMLADIRGLGGEEDILRLDLTSLPGDAGGPVVDAGGNVLGVLLPRGGGARQLPDSASFAVKAGVAQAFLQGAGIRVATEATGAAIDPSHLTDKARDMTALVGCWE